MEYDGVSWRMEDGEGRIEQRASPEEGQKLTDRAKQLSTSSSMLRCRARLPSTSPSPNHSIPMSASLFLSHAQQQRSPDRDTLHASLSLSLKQNTQLHAHQAKCSMPERASLSQHSHSISRDQLAPRARSASPSTQLSSPPTLSRTTLMLTPPAVVPSHRSAVPTSAVSSEHAVPNTACPRQKTPCQQPPQPLEAMARDASLSLNRCQCFSRSRA